MPIEVSYMTDELRPPRRIDVVGSWSALIVLNFAATLFVLYVPRHREATKTLYQNFGMKMRAISEFVCDVPTPMIIAFGMLIVGAGVAVQTLLRNKRSALLIHLLLIAVVACLYFAYKWAIGDPVAELMASTPPIVVR